MTRFIGHREALPVMDMLLPHSDGHVDHGVLLHAIGVLNVDAARAHVAHG